MTNTIKNHYPFWKVSDKGKININSSNLVKFIAEKGFGLFQTEDERTSNKTLFLNNKGVLELHNSNTLKSWLIGIIETDEDIDPDVKDELQDKLVKLAPKTLGNYVHNLPIYSQKGFNDTQVMKIFKDTPDNCYISFKNGVVKISAHKIELVDREDLLNQGCIWEASIIPHNIDILDKYMVTQNNVFKNFVHYAMKKDIEPFLENNDYNLGTDNSRFKESVKSFETGFGYLIHNYQPPEDQRVVVFCDVDSSPDRTEGGNGKSLSMKMVSYYRKEAFLDGDKVRPSSSGEARFNFSNVKHDTGFVNINDLPKNFELRQFFSLIADKFQIEGKGKDKFIIEQEDKPKVGITTNYVIQGMGNSYERRQHIVEFGNFWNIAGNKKITPPEILGKVIGKDFDENDWIKFYNYGFQCVQKYLLEGLQTQSLESYNRKNLISVLEGEGGTGEVLSWFEYWISTTRISNKFDVNGIYSEDLFHTFQKENSLLALKNGWSYTKFMDTFYDYVKTREDLIWNPDKVTSGNTRSSRRIRKGSRDSQRDFVIIVNKSNTENNFLNVA